MNSNILLPRRKAVVSLSNRRRNPSWLLRIARWIGKRRRMDALFRFYRKLGNDRRTAWDKAGKTI